METFTIRPATPHDVPALHVLYQQLDDVHAVAEPDVVPPHEQAPRATADIESGLDEDHVLVATAGDGQVVGFARIRIVQLGTYFMFPAVPEVEDLAVLAGVRGRGVGKQLMAAAEDWAERAGYPEIWVSAWTFNEPAAGLYQRQGFQPLSTRFRKRIAARQVDSPHDPTS